jgi:hypothetical protein
MNGTRLNGNELERMLAEAVKALNAPSPVLEKAPKMSKGQLRKEIDTRIEQITSGTLTGEALETAKIEARTLALLKLRRG